MKIFHLKIIVFLVFINGPLVFGQGCVAIRGNSACGGSIGSTLNLHKGEFNAQFGFRHFKSFRHYRGAEEETNRVEEGTQVINKSTFVDLSLTYGISSRFYGNIILPLAYNSRSSMYEHGGNPPNGLGDRRTTASHGIADMRLGVGYWLFDPAKHKFNYAVGLGVKLPTGKYDYTDTFYNQGAKKDQEIEAVVDQSIQLGDGGLGITMDFQGFHPITHNIGISTNLYYLFNTKATNGVLTRNSTSEFSCPDQFAVRVGGSYNGNNGFNFYVGGRLEGVPATDAIGSSAGYRRPGYAVSVEPGVGYYRGNYSIFVSCPLALYRNRIQSYEDKEKTQITGVYTQGDAAFADYSISFGFSYRFGGHSHMAMTDMPTIPMTNSLNN